jgi:hypothetical protein
MLNYRLDGSSPAIGRRGFLAIAGAFVSVGRPLFGTENPKQILIIRHAEKTGSKTDIHLNSRGYTRAAALPALFPVRFDTPISFSLRNNRSTAIGRWKR